jgi:hypothetical protein
MPQAAQAGKRDRKRGQAVEDPRSKGMSDGNRRSEIRRFPSGRRERRAGEDRHGETETRRRTEKTERLAPRARAAWAIGRQREHRWSLVLASVARSLHGAGRRPAPSRRVPRSSINLLRSPPLLRSSVCESSPLSKHAATRRLENRPEDFIRDAFGLHGRVVNDGRSRLVWTLSFVSDQLVWTRERSKDQKSVGLLNSRSSVLVFNGAAVSVIAPANRLARLAEGATMMRRCAASTEYGTRSSSA